MMPFRPNLPYHKTLDISRVEKEPDSGSNVVFVTVPPFKRKVQYKQVEAVVNIRDTWSIVELCVSKPKDDVSLYQGYVTIEKSDNSLTSFLDYLKKEQPDKNPLLILHFVMSGPNNEEVRISFLLTEYFVDIFDEQRTYFTADGSIISVRGQVFENGSAISRTQNK